MATERPSEDRQRALEQRAELPLSERSCRIECVVPRSSGSLLECANCPAEARCATLVAWIASI
jgi:hypothetical protein